jgi:hypothetical protein
LFSLKSSEMVKGSLLLKLISSDFETATKKIILCTCWVAAFRKYAGIRNSQTCTSRRQKEPLTDVLPCPLKQRLIACSRNAIEY